MTRGAIIRYGLFAVVAYLFFAVATLPAQFAVDRLQQQLPAGVSVYGIEGTVWSGSAASVRIGNREYRELSWDFEPLALLAGRLQYILGFNNGASRGSAVVGRSLAGNLLFQDVAARLTADDVHAWINLAPVRLTGVVDADLQRLKIVDGRITAADGTIAWKQAGLQAPRAVVLGEVGVNLETIDEGVQGTITDRDGAVQASGVLTLTRAGEYRFNGVVAARDPADTGLAQALRLLGKTGPDGKVNVSFSGKVPPLFGSAARGT